MNPIIFRICQIPAFPNLVDHKKDNDLGYSARLTFDICLNFKSKEEFEEFTYKDSFTEAFNRIESKYGIHDCSPSEETINGLKCWIEEYTSYEIEDFVGCAKEWFEFFVKEGVIANEESNRAY